MTARLLFFSTLRDYFGRSEREVQVSPGDTVRKGFEALFAEPDQARLNQASKFACSIRFAVNCEYVSDDALVHEGDEVAFIPPVSGG